MKPFCYERPHDAKSAVALLDGSDGSMFLGGGTNLVDLMRLEVATPSLLVDVSRLPFDRLEESDSGGLVIGAAMRNSDLAAELQVRRRYPVLAEALLAGASGQLRNLATVGGNLLQRTRCAYFQDVTRPCNKRNPGSGCPAHEGEHRNLAILGWSDDCVATHPSDMAVALAALDAVVHVQGPIGQRTVPLVELHRLPGTDPSLDTVLARGELVTAVELPPPSGRSAYRKVRERASFSFAIVSVAASLDLSDGVIREARVALGGVAHKPWRATLAEQELRGKSPGESTFMRAAERELETARPLRDNGYKIPLARNLIVRTLCELVEAT
ncbi:MAG TPA: xanthine dehydrogenase family protein subunit M [Gaiellaceae bacterium]|nr:xanthine dehydrogenase family protein subunit M [Gaiellaceae bacterium]